MIDMDLSTYLASSSGEEDNEGAEALKKLARGDEAPPEELGDMEATFSMKASQLEEDLAERAKKIGSKVHSLETANPKTVWEKYLEKKKEKRRDKRKEAKAERIARRKGEAAGSTGEKDEDEDAGAAGEDDLGLLAAGDAEDDDRGFNQRGPQRRAHKGGEGKKRKKHGGAENEEGTAGFQVNVEDPRIAAVFSSADFEIDPTNPEYRRTEGMGAVLKQRGSARPSA